MILLISEEGDTTTYEVLQWIKFYGKKYVRINQEDEVFVALIDFESEDIIIRIKDVEINLKDVKFTWYRRGFFDFKLAYFLELEREAIKKTIKEESSFLNTFIMRFLTKQTININDYFTSHNNKLITLLEAKTVGLKIPNTYITSYSKELRNIDIGLITKSMGAHYIAVNNENSTIEMAYTEKVKLAAEECFFPSLFQEEIIKKLEIRTFFFLNRFYSMAIFSQSNDKTRTDFRKYDNVAPNRTVPFKLPASIERQLLELLRRLKLNCCSIDLIQNSNGEYVFLEVNPIGQFGMVSKPCNYYLEKIVANKLTDYE